MGDRKEGLSDGLEGRRRFKMGWKKRKEFESRARGEGRGVIELSERIYNPVRPAWQLLQV